MIPEGERMRKSEMIKLLKQDIKDADGDLDLQANMVLSRVLSCRMLPPDYYIKYDENGKYIPHFNYWTIVKNEWEPENEEK